MVGFQVQERLVRETEKRDEKKLFSWEGIRESTRVEGFQIFEWRVVLVT